MGFISENQKRLLQHMLGADSRYMKKQWGFRNHFCASDNPECKSRLDLEALEKKGFVKSGERLGYKTFWATKEGAISIGFKLYQLRKTDFPK